MLEYEQYFSKSKQVICKFFLFIKFNNVSYSEKKIK